MSETTATPGQTVQALFNIEKLYVKDLSLEIPHAPGYFWNVKVPRSICN